MVDNYVQRHENILCMAHNTIRINDLPIQKFMDDVAKIYLSPIQAIKKTLGRTNRQLGEEYGLDNDFILELREKLYVSTYDDAPYTPVFTMLNNLKSKSFVSKIHLMYNTFGGHVDVSELDEPDFEITKYDGSIEEIESYIKEHNITCLIVDDIDTVHELMVRKNITIDGMTFIISKFGFNFELNEESGKYRMKHNDIFDAYIDKSSFEFAFIDLYNFTDEELEEANANG